MIQMTNIPMLSFIDDFREEVQGIGNKLIPNFWSFLTQLLALIILIIVFMLVAYKPVKKMLNARAENIENNIKTAQTYAQISEQNLKQSEETIIASKKKANDIIAEATVKASEKQKEMIDETNKEIVRLKKEAEKDIEASRQAALDEIHDEMVNVAISASEVLLKREINKEDDSRIVEEFIKNAD